MLCRLCGCPGAAEIFVGLICFNDRCDFFDKRAMEKASFDGENYTVNGDSIIEINDFLDHRDGDPL